MCCLGVGASAAPVDCNFLAVSNAVATGGVHTLACGGTIVFPQILTVSPGTTVTLEATGAPVTFDGENARPLISIAAGGRLVLKNVRLVRGFGGAIGNSGDLTLERCVLADNFAKGTPGTTNYPVGGSARGGAIYQDEFGTLRATSCVFSNNVVLGGRAGDPPCLPPPLTSGGHGLGGAIFLEGGSNEIDHCTFDGNRAIAGEAACSGPPGIAAGAAICVGNPLSSAIGHPLLRQCGNTFRNNYTVSLGGPTPSDPNLMLALGESTTECIGYSTQPFQVTVAATAGRRYHLLASSNLVDWTTNLTRQPVANTTLRFLPVSSSSPYQFYRVLQE